MKAQSKEKFSSYTHGEAKTGGGQLVSFSCGIGSRDEVKTFLKEKIRAVTIPETHRSNVEHGGYGRYSRFSIKQHRYAGGDGEDGGYCMVEVLEIQDAPDERVSTLLYQESSNNGGAFIEWESLESAKAAFKSYMHSQTTDWESFYSKLPGFKRYVSCTGLAPWFYAVGTQELIGDYAFPERMQDDSVYTIGRKFVVYDSDKMPMIKTCLGCRFIEKKPDPSYSWYGREVETQYYRIVYWDDGTCWDEHSRIGKAPIPAVEGEIWITEAVEKFKRFLTGYSPEFSINFTNGDKFVGKLVEPKGSASSPEGQYYLKVKIKGETKLKEGYVDFIPTAEAKNIVELVTKKFVESGKVIETLEVSKQVTVEKGKKWQGLFFNHR